MKYSGEGSSVFEDTYSQPDAPDPVLDDDLVLALVRRHVPEARAVTGVDESGGEARTYAIDDTIILKVQRPQQLRPRTSLEKEVFFLRQLEQAPEARVPRALGLMSVLLLPLGFWLYARGIERARSNGTLTRWQ